MIFKPHFLIFKHYFPFSKILTEMAPAGIAYHWRSSVFFGDIKHFYFWCNQQWSDTVHRDTPQDLMCIIAVLCNPRSLTAHRVGMGSVLYHHCKRWFFHSCHSVCYDSILSPKARHTKNYNCIITHTQLKGNIKQTFITLLVLGWVTVVTLMALVFSLGWHTY